MFKELTQLRKGRSGRLLLAVVLLVFLYISPITDLLRGTESISWLILDLIAVVVIVLMIITTVWPQSGEALSQIDEEYGSYISLAIGIFFISWAFYLLITGSDELIFLLISLGGALVGIFDFLWSLVGQRDPSRAS